MTKKWTNQNLAGALHFVTGNVLNRLSIFRQERNSLAFLNELQQLRNDIESKLIAFVLMPDHFHLVVNPRNGKITEWTGSLKSISAKHLIELAPVKSYGKGDDTNQVWQESFKPCHYGVIG
jgi:REP element-mobilizing transposase RayT